MLFNSLEFLVFFPPVTLFYFMLRRRPRIYLLLAASSVFYMAFVPSYILILALTIVVDYVAGIRIERTTGAARRVWLLFSIVVTCAILFFFKYFNFASESASFLLGLENPIPALEILLPIGLSFHTFQSLSYVIEVYLGRQKAETDFSLYSLYVLFYPQLVAGPIERPQSLLRQFRIDHRFDAARACDGLRLMGWGLFMKVVIADRFAPHVDKVFNDPAQSHAGGPQLAAATILFAFQIYCDFAGYSNIAIGAAKVMGFDLMRNFDQPYFSRSISEFWRRWHISLSTWFKDYVYIPLGGNRVAIPRMCLNLLIVFLISGIWHGANWTFVVWGALHGTYLIVAHATASWRETTARRVGLAAFPGLHSALQVTTTFALVCLGWIFFRAESVGDAFWVIGRLHTGWEALLAAGSASAVAQAFGLTPFDAQGALGLIAFLLLVDKVRMRHGKSTRLFMARPTWLRMSAYSVAGWAILLLGVFGSNTFIYFTF